MARKTLSEIAANPGGTSKSELTAALRRAGWVLHREGAAHEVWRKGRNRVAVPRSLKKAGTIRAIARSAIAGG